MSTTSDKLNYLLETKNAIKNALIEKEVEVNDTDTFRSYADKISSLELGGSDGLYIQDTEPTITSSPSVWLDTSNGSNILKIHDGEKWVNARGTWA